MGSYYLSQRMINTFVFLCLISKMSKKRSVLKLVNENEIVLVIICPIKMFTWTQNSFISMSQKILWKSVGEGEWK